MMFLMLLLQMRMSRSKQTKKWQESLNELEKGNKVVYKGQKCMKESFDKIRKMALEGQNLKVQSKGTYIAQVWGSKSENILNLNELET